MRATNGPADVPTGRVSITHSRQRIHRALPIWHVEIGPHDLNCKDRDCASASVPISSVESAEEVHAVLVVVLRGALLALGCHVSEEFMLY